jgi:hypothetical protein
MIAVVHDDDLRNVLETVFMGILMSASAHDPGKPYGYFADNVVPKQMLYRNAFRLFHFRLSRLVVRCTDSAPLLPRAPVYELVTSDASDPATWKGHGFDCVVTSPPYPSAVDYTNAFRLASHWFPRFASLDSLRLLEIGARSLRKRREAKEHYFQRMHSVFGHLVDHLRPGGSLALVLPKGRVQTPTIQRILRDILTFPRLRQVATLERRILNRYFVRKDGGIKSEVVTVFRKSRL